MRVPASLPALLLAASYLAAPRSAAAAGASAGGKVENFALLDHQGIERELYRYRSVRAILIALPDGECGAVTNGVRALRGLHRRFMPRGAAVLLMESRPGCRRDALARLARDAELGFPLLMDYTQAVARSLGLRHPGDAAVIAPAEWAFAYLGSLREPGAAAEALEALLASRPVTPVGAASVSQTFAPLAAAAAYSKVVAPILKKDCLSCHDRGTAIPLDTYSRARAWAPMIRETLLTRRMPPLSVDPEYGEFKNGGLSTASARALIEWAEQGAPSGPDDGASGKDSTATPERRGWSLGDPDAVFLMEREQRLPPDGPLDWRYVPLVPRVSEDMWVDAITLRGNSSIRHHGELFALPPPSEPPASWAAYTKRFLKDDYGRYHLTVLGQRSDAFYAPEGTALLVPKGRVLVLVMHYSASGREERDRTAVGFYRYKGPGRPKPLKIDAIMASRLAIPPGAQDHTVSAERFYSKAMDVHALAPHMHRRGVRMRFDAVLHDGTARTLLSVPRYRLQWQRRIALAAPLSLPAGSRIVVTGGYDNSALNPLNPDPSRWVRKGPSFDDEMLVGWVYYTEP